MEHEENRLLKLINELREKTFGMCRAGVGPFGIGISNMQLSHVGAVIALNPDPFGTEPLPSDIKECTAVVVSICTERKGGRYGARIEREKLLELCEDEDRATQAVAKALFELSENPVTISLQECYDTHDLLAFTEPHGHDRELAAEEIEQISELRWYESKEADEILQFQLFQEELYMPLHTLRDTLTEALGREVEIPEIQSAEGLRELRKEWKLSVFHKQGIHSPDEIERFIELEMNLTASGFETQMVEQRMQVSMDGKNLCQIDRKGGIQYAPQDVRGLKRERACIKVKEIVNSTEEYMNLMKQAALWTINTPHSRYRLLSEHNGVVLLGEESAEGTRFAIYEKKGVLGIWSQCCLYGGYQYESAKEDFSVRSGLVNQNRLFSDRQLMEIYRCVSETLEMEYPMTEERKTGLEGIVDRIQSIVPDLDQLVYESDAQEIEQTM